MSRIRTYLPAVILSLFLLTTVEISMTGCAARVVYVRKAPPPPRVEVRPPRPSARAVWIPGHWRWNGRAYVWIPGHWDLHPKGKVWVPGHWKKTRNGYRWVPGYWKR